MDSDDIDDSYKNDSFFRDFSAMFKLGNNCSCLIMRHLYTSICNYLFPSNGNNINSGRVSTVNDVAEMSGHSAETHDAYYSSGVNKEAMFDKYHEGIGAEIILREENANTQTLATEMDALHCVKNLFGMNANFLSDLQERMVLDACNNVTKHTFCSIGCGGGKSVSWMIPSLRQRIERSMLKVSIVVIPYCFLLDHHVGSTKKSVGQCSNISVESLKGRQIEDNLLPNILRDKDTLPSILFVSLEAIRKLVEHHWYYLEQLQNEDRIFKIYIDECHTILSELSFRSSYTCLSKLAKLNIPVAVFSGSFQRGFIRDFMKFMFGSKELGLYNLYIDLQIFGDRLMRMNHVASDRYMNDCCSAVEKFANNHDKSNIHIIVSTKNEGEQVVSINTMRFVCNDIHYVFDIPIANNIQSLSNFAGHTIYNLLMGKKISCKYIDSESTDQTLVASEWNNDSLKVLITTTIGLVGNESSRTQMVCIVGLLYNLPSIV